MKLNHSKLLKGVFTEIVGSLEHQSDIVSFANRHRARLDELNNKKNDKFKLLGIGRVKQIKECIMFLSIVFVSHFIQLTWREAKHLANLF